MGAGFFDSMWDPYSGAFAYPRTEPRGWYYRPRAPVYEQRGRVQPESDFLSKVKVGEPGGRKTVRTIPVTDGNVQVEVKSQPEESQGVEVEVARPVVRFESEAAAVRKIQAVYRGYAVRRTEPLKHLRVIGKVREEFEGLKRKLEEREQRAKLCSDSQERLRWTEGIMALLLRLDQLQGVYPDVRLVRKAVAKELLVFQETIDSMSGSVAEEEGVGVDDAVAEEGNVEDDHEEVKSEVCDAAEEAVGVIDGQAATEAVEEVEVEENKSNVEDVDVEEATQVEADATIAIDGRQEAMEQDSAPAEESNDQEHDSDGIKVTEISPFEHDVPRHYNCEEVTNCEDQGGSPSESSIGESMVEDAEQDGVEVGFAQAAGEVPMDVENESSTMAPARDLEGVEVKADSPQIVPSMDIESGHEEVSAVDDPVGIAPPADFDGEPMVKEAELGDSTDKNDSMGNLDRSHDVGRGDETERLDNEAEMPAFDTLGNNGDDSLACPSYPEERAADAGDGWMIPACPMSLQPQSSAKSVQVGQPQISTTAGVANSLSDRALLEQLLEENRKLKDVVGKVLHWGKQQNDIIHNLASRIEQLEEPQPQSNMLHGEKINGRKRICNDGGLVGDRERSLRSKGRRKGRRGNGPQFGYLDSEWLSAESDEYF